MTELWEAIQPELIEALITLALTLIGLMATWACNSLRRKFDSERAVLQIDAAENAARLVVRELEQTLVPVIKEAVASNTLTRAEKLAMVKRTAVDLVVTHVGKGLKQALASSAVEAAVLDLKRSSYLPPPPPVPAFPSSLADTQS